MIPVIKSGERFGWIWLGVFCFTHKLRLGKKHKALQVAEVMNQELISSVAHIQVRAYAIAVSYF